MDEPCPQVRELWITGALSPSKVRDFRARFNSQLGRENRIQVRDRDSHRNSGRALLARRIEDVKDAELSGMENADLSAVKKAELSGNKSSELSEVGGRHALSAWVTARSTRRVLPAGTTGDGVWKSCGQTRVRFGHNPPGFPRIYRDFPQCNYLDVIHALNTTACGCFHFQTQGVVFRLVRHYLEMPENLNVMNPAPGS